MANCIYCNFKFDAHDTVEGEVIGGAAYCKRCLYGETSQPGGWMWEPNDVGCCKRCNREDTLGKFSRLCNDCADDVSN